MSNIVDSSINKISANDLASDASAVTVIFRIIALIFATLFISALVTPSIYVFLEWIYQREIWPYSRVFDRVAMLVVFLLIYRFRSFFYLRGLWADAKPYLSQQKFLLIALGAFISFSTSFALISLIVSGETLEWSSVSREVMAWKFAKAVPAALLISFIEELFFRFFLFLTFRKKMSFLPAAALSSIIYSFVHFIQPVKSWKLDDNTLMSGFEYLVVIFERYALPGIIPASIGLFLVGITLCYMVEKTSSLLPSIGLHAGWVYIMKIILTLTVAAEGFVYPQGSGRRYYLLTHEITWVSVVLVCGVSYLLFYKFMRIHRETA